MPRYKLTIEYDGRPFVGWQVQDNGPSVQGALMLAIEAFCGERVKVGGAGRIQQSFTLRARQDATNPMLTAVLKNGTPLLR